jgi:hypothetical protein
VVLRFDGERSHAGDVAAVERAAEGQAFGGDEAKALAAYNAGAGRVKSAMAKAKESGGAWIDYMPEETRNYVGNITMKLHHPKFPQLQIS